MSCCRGGNSVSKDEKYEKRMSSSGDIFLISFEEKALVEQRTAVEIKILKNTEEYYTTCSKGVGE